MKKLNLNNQISQDDEKLINLLKASTAQEGSERLMEDTLKTLRLLQTKPRPVHQPLKSPLYMMLFIVLVLLAPLFVSFTAQVETTGLGFEITHFVENISFESYSWYALTPVLLVVVLLSVVWVELGLFNFRIPSH